MGEIDNNPSPGIGGKAQEWGRPSAAGAGIPRRFPDWPERLDDFIRARWHMPFAWGTNDCLLFAGGAVEAMTGVDPFAPARDLYKTRRGALRAMKAHGYATYGDLLRDVLGEPCTGWKRAQRGDLVIFDQPKVGATLGVMGVQSILVAGRLNRKWWPASSPIPLLYWPVGR